MTTPAPHTPINFVKGGASLFFSARCVQLLAKAGYLPDDFGTYAQVQKRNKSAKDKVQTWQDARAQALEDGVPPDQVDDHLRRQHAEERDRRIEAGASEADVDRQMQADGQPVPPSQHERFLAECQSGAAKSSSS
ncbi:hypothetical protein ENSA5_11810 [Enhygromyxa salina]|uniref:Uncharacterized protein n=1 Tax=Enhygromyxa salina TaxID=215803 RepID=A0A2S9YFW9_9BACT|nr:hypothetical protein [Enhygromyxa salina]PRQ03998.1 hypothetical protein ENSA5_11810 [Enhygromyxa salina]